MAIQREQAWTHLCEWTKTDALRKHARAVEVVMRAAALRYGAGAADVERFGLAGMLHDADYEAWPEDHLRRIVAWLREQGEAEVAHAVSAHYTKWGVAYESALDKALLACDELTGFIGACCHVREGGILSLEPKSVLKKLKDKGFAAKVERGEVQAGVDLLGVEPGVHIAFVIEALRPHAAELGILGKAPAANP
ncbi:MAG TPA: metal-dependent phosphohydrolase [Planctomycetota bacterium]|nr:metal-dependent phosphohydrolase [Planctomycetota bacterium]